MIHLCHARACKVEVPPKMLMCREHWRLVPADLKKAVWAHYVHGQERRKDPTERYLEVAREAIKAVYRKERKKFEAARQTTLFQ